MWVDAMFVYGDPCQWPGTERSTGTTPHEWVATIGEIGELSPTAPMDVEVGGYAAKRIQITVSADVDTDDCVDGEYRV